ncbi:S-adenosyl-L-methionine-dependent methyltransferases superfamily protein [Klebsormidium nitens]|uniref:S-adenosyl-L-methionine-dependent methyltransferases superfamily protein n=1 Tax=Klebsormidium nitens TaxID=105231 RepID=A0A1Y1HHH9_KLENI|nr:S-adenosyl-L-methionine-dependent methyltransferases superfamily protein [Klebsormidium nitens]|eukprot:GAQ77924.1 S-adenosyl-L-methionine-dependent methyltransferases superfamily protein [Klebsormidium nitens]
MEAQDELQWLAPGRKVVLQYTPPNLTPPPSVLADCVHLSPEDAPQRVVTGAPNDHELQHRMRNGQARSTSQDSGGALVSESMRASRTSTVALDEATTIPGAERLLRNPKYTATVIDAFPEHDRAFKHISTVFIIPQGMELDWLISTPEGQAQVVAGADAARVFLVTLNRGHTFTSAEQVQKELSPWIRTLTNGVLPTLNPTAIPYTTTPQGIGHRTVLIKVESNINGPIVVEDVRLTEPGKLQPTTFRRMVFLDSPSLIQSEAVLIHTEPGERSGRGGADDVDERQTLFGAKLDVDGVIPGTNTEECDGCDRNEAAGERMERDHRKKARRRGVGSLDGGQEGDAPTRASKKASGEELGVASEGEQDHRKRARRRHEERLGSSGTGGNHQKFEANAAQEESEFSGSLSPPDRSISQQGGEKLAKGAEAESLEHATCSEDADGVNTSGEASDRRERQASCTTNAGGGLSGMTSAGVAEERSGAVEILERAGAECRNGGVLMGVDFSYLASDYLQAMVAGLAFLGPGIEERTESGGLLDVLVIGLGGGGMPMFLRRHLPCRVEVIEIDPTVVELAETYFGVFRDAAFQVHVVNAIPWVILAATTEVPASKSRKASFDAVLIDVESAGGPCPPPAFLKPRFLSALRALLRPNGVLAMNVVATDEIREATYKAVRCCLSDRLYEWSIPQNSNRVLFSHRQSGLASPDLSQTPAESSRGGESDNDDAVDLVYWASRLAEKGAGMTSWARGPDLPSLVADIQTL